MNIRMRSQDILHNPAIVGVMWGAGPDEELWSLRAPIGHMDWRIAASWQRQLKSGCRERGPRIEFLNTEAVVVSGAEP